MDTENLYYIETSLGKIPFMSSDLRCIRVSGRKQKDFNCFRPINNTKFLKLAEEYSSPGTIRTISVSSTYTKNGYFLVFHSDLDVEYKIFDGQNHVIKNSH